MRYLTVQPRLSQARKIMILQGRGGVCALRTIHPNLVRIVRQYEGYVFSKRNYSGTLKVLI
jgi:hypothetical protein